MKINNKTKQILIGIGELIVLVAIGYFVNWQLSILLWVLLYLNNMENE